MIPFAFTLNAPSGAGTTMVASTKAEACVGLGDDPAAQEPFNEAKAMAPASYMVESTETQMTNLKKLPAAVKTAD